MATLDGFLNVVIPLGIILFFAGILYMKLKEPIHAFASWIKSLFVRAKERVVEPTYTEIIYN